MIMNPFPVVPVALALVLSVAGCASPPPSASSSVAQEPMAEKEFRTGSRIPVRDPVAASPTTTAGPSALGPGVPPRTN
jgi:hypothetical protein